MNFSNYKFTLDMHTAQSQVSLPVVLNDTARKFYISLSDGGKSYHIADGCLALVRINRPTGTYVEHFCSIEDNTNIVYDLSQFENTAIIPGIHDCEVTLYGLEDEVITTARFTMVVSARVVDSDNVEIKDENWTMLDEIGNEEARRQASESARNKAETLRAEAEKERVKAESERETNTAIAIEAANSVAAELLRKAEDGEFNGKDGTSVTITDIKESSVDGGNNVVSFSDGNKLNIKNGSAGSPGTGGGGSIDADQLNAAVEEALQNAKDSGEFGGFDGKSVIAYGAVGDGSTDDTAAFQAALAENRVVVVPEGTYKLSDTLTIGANCCLELSQSTVLVFTQTDKNCISMLRLASLRGNHATIFVPYTFSANVINCDTTDDVAVLDPDDLNNSNAVAVPPFTKWDPQWKMSRYVTDINICKRNSSGFHYSDDGKCYGTAIWMGCYEDTIKFMWGISMSGVRIAGGFTYGIRIYSEGEAWNHDMRVEAVIDGSEIAVLVENTNFARLNVTIQPRPAANGAVYAKHGIKLINAKGIDLSSSRVWDWNSSNTLFSPNNQYQYLAMIGNCSGAVIDDYGYYINGDTRERIYTDTPSNLEKLTIMQEPIDVTFKMRDGTPYCSDGATEKRLVAQDEMKSYFDTDVTKNFTDVLPTAIDTDGSVYNGIGYKTGGYIQANGVYKDVGYNYCVSTGFIPCKMGSKIYASGMSFDVEGGDGRIVLYDADFNYVMHVNRGNLLAGGTWYVGYEETDNGFVCTVNSVEGNNNIAYARFSIYHSNWSKYPMISIDEEIKYTVDGFLADGINVKGDSVIMSSPSGKSFKLVVNDSGALSTVAME